ncbi:Putative odorant receptor 9a [Eufriesea mexicana]|uniref:Odorant receptor n=1 Tax=Eufriesea mexicana TaxID=516756 RepID=A0A310SI41_9HYME|nr:PREDICTED: odorant receptor 82a-like [Eufriesea mexicana]OAD62200.1 Putative odorant receptor 9a [Eufriesea mexicana]
MKRPISFYVELFYDEHVISWSKRLLSLSGLWPDNRNDVRFFFYITYVVIFTWLEIVTLLQNIHDLERTLKNITLSFPTILIVLKAVMFRLNMHLVLPLLMVVERDVKQGLYRTPEERRTVVWYNVAATLFSTSSALSLFFVPTLFYTKPIVSCLLSKFNNCTLPYELPMKVNNVYEVTGVTTYALFCVYLVPTSMMLTIGATGADSLLVTLTFYLCSQLSVLAQRVRNIDVEPQIYFPEMRALVERHSELLRMANILAETFSSLMFIQTLGLIFSLCIVVYQLLTTTESGEDMNTIHFVIYSCAVILLAFCYCFLGECLINESNEIQLACYSTNWYDLPGEYTRSLMFCIARSQKPQYLTAGKFYVFSLETFGVIVKASMAYLSVMKNMI